MGSAMRIYLVLILLAGLHGGGLQVQADTKSGLRGSVELKTGGKLEGWVRFERELLLLTEANGKEHSIGGAELKVAHVHLADRILNASPGLKASYFRQPGLVGPFTERIDGMIDFNWGAMAPMPDFPADNFSVRWDGEIESTMEGNYSFHVTGSEGARLWINGRNVIDRWVNKAPKEYSGIVQLEGRQRYPFRLECLEGGGDAAIHLRWNPPGGEKAVVPASQFSHVPGQETRRNGLLGSYHKGSNFKGDPMERIDPVIDFSWVATGPMPGFGINYFSIRWEGEIEAPISGPVTFHATTDDGVRLWVGEQLIIDEWRPRVAAESRGEMVLQAGRRYPVRMDYYQATQQASARFSWSGPGLKEQLVPEKSMFAKPPIKPPREISPGLVLKGGSFLAGKVTGIDEKDVRISYLDKRQIKVRRQNVGALQFVPLTPSGLTQVSERRPGSVLRGGDYFVSGLISIDEGHVEVSSPVFGRRRLSVEDVLFIKLGNFGRKEANFEVRTRSGSLLLADWLMLDGKRALVKDNSFCWVNLEPGDVTAVYGVATGRGEGR